MTKEQPSLLLHGKHYAHPRRIFVPDRKLPPLLVSVQNWVEKSLGLGLCLIFSLFFMSQKIFAQGTVENPSEEYIRLKQSSPGFAPLVSKEDIAPVSKNIPLGKANRGTPLKKTEPNKISVSAPTQGQIILLRTATIFEKPTRASKIVQRLALNEVVKPLSQSPDKSWVKIQARGIKGWIEKSFLGTETGKKQIGLNENELLFAEEIEEPEVGKQRFFVKVSMKFFDEPNPLAMRFGLLEAKDEVFVLKKSEDGSWVFIQLELTGEEGWVPSNMISVKREEAIGGSTGNSSLELEGGWASQDYNFGYGGGYFYNLKPGGFTESSRDRLELGATFMNWQGASFKFVSGTTETSLVATYWNTAGLLRYVFSSEDGFTQGALEGGVSYNSATVTVSGISSLILDNAGINTVPSGFGGLLGARGYYCLTPNWYVFGGVRMHLASIQVYMLSTGLNYRF